MKRLLLITCLWLVTNCGCVATLTFGVHKDWAAESHGFHNPDLRTSIEVKFTNNHFLGQGSP